MLLFHLITTVIRNFTAVVTFLKVRCLLLGHRLYSVLTPIADIKEVYPRYRASHSLFFLESFELHTMSTKVQLVLESLNE
jgi:hypothetical protein